MGAKLASNENIQSRYIEQCVAEIPHQAWILGLKAVQLFLMYVDGFGRKMTRQGGFDIFDIFF